MENPGNNTDDQEYLVKLALFISQEFYDREMREMLYRLSYYDSLTSLRNRNSYKQLWETAGNRGMKKVGVAFIDINGLKRVNDEMGHLKGDQLIKRTAGILKKYASEEEVYRISGDEFVVVLQNMEKDEFLSRMKELKSDMKAHNDIASMGCAWQESVTDIDKVFKEAEIQMYQHKNHYYQRNPENNRRKR